MKHYEKFYQITDGFCRYGIIFEVGMIVQEFNGITYGCCTPDEVPCLIPGREGFFGIPKKYLQEIDVITHEKIVFDIQPWPGEFVADYSPEVGFWTPVILVTDKLRKTKYRNEFSIWKISSKGYELRYFGRQE